jgi:hypothetical protein
VATRKCCDRDRYQSDCICPYDEFRAVHAYVEEADCCCWLVD